MKKDFDFVSMDDYSKDMAALSASSAAIITALKKERDDANRMLAHIIAEVGEVRIYEGVLHEPAPMIRRELEMCSMEYVFRAMN